MSDDHFVIDIDDLDGVAQPDRRETLSVYLASPLTACSQDETSICDALRFVVRRCLESYLGSDARIEVYDPASVTSPGSNHTSQEVYFRNHQQTACSDLVVFLAELPSTGMGMETEIAGQYTRPRLIICRRSRPVSRMLEGQLSPQFPKLEYSTIEELQSLLSDQLPGIVREVLKSKRRRESQLGDNVPTLLGSKVFRHRIFKGVSLSDLAASVDSTEQRLDALERDPAVAWSFNQGEVARICTVLEMRCDVMRFDAVGDLQFRDEVQRESFENLINLAQHDRADDKRIIRIWTDYVDGERELDTAVSFRNRQPVSDQEWKDRYQSSGGLLF